MYEFSGRVRAAKMSYVDVYFSRVNHMGETTAERIQNGGIRSFMKWLAQSPQTVRELSVERGIYFDAIIEENKDKEHKKIMFMHVSNKVAVVVGDIVNWTLQDGTVEKWLILQEEKKTNPIFKTFWIIRCNYLLRWVDQQGHVQESWSYFTSSLDSMIKGNYRTWHNVIAAQPNKYAEVIMPRHDVFRSTNFIVEEESWSVVEYDHTSVPGTVYLSLTEGKINSLTDDIKNNLADTDKIAVYTVQTAEEVQSFKINDFINPVFTLMKNGKSSDEKVRFNIANNKIAKYVDGKIKAISAGEVELKAIIDGVKDPIGSITIQVIDTEEQPKPLINAYIEGPDKIKLARKGTYIFTNGTELDDVPEFSIREEDQKYATLITDKESPYTCIIEANEDNQLGSITLVVTYQGIEYTKTISIIPLW